jgi:L-lactate utilization protein LutB
MARERQHGATRDQIADSVAACTLCGACEPACPENLPLVDMVMELKSGDVFPSPNRSSVAGSGQLLLAGRELRADLERRTRTLALLEGHDLARTMATMSPMR